MLLSWWPWQEVPRERPDFGVLWVPCRVDFGARQFPELFSPELHPSEKGRGGVGSREALVDAFR